MHESGQSHYNYDVDRSKIKYVDKDTHVVYTMSGQQDVVKRLKKSNFECNEDNSNKQADCLNNYYASKLNCTLPWVQADNRHVMEKINLKNLETCLCLLWNLEQPVNFTRGDALFLIVSKNHGTLHL